MSSDFDSVDPSFRTFNLLELTTLISSITFIQDTSAFSTGSTVEVLASVGGSDEEVLTSVDTCTALSKTVDDDPSPGQRHTVW